MKHSAYPKIQLGLAQRNTKRCPECKGQQPKEFPREIVKMTCWCPHCERIWRIRRSEYTWKAWWYPLIPTAHNVRTNE